MRDGRRAHRGLGDAVGEPRVDRRPAPARRRVRAPAPRAGAQLRAGGARPATSSATRDGDAVRRALVDGHRLAGRLHLARGRATGGASRPRGVLDARRRGDQGRRRRGLLLPATTCASPTAAAAPRPRGRYGAALPALDAARARRGRTRGSGVLFGRSRLDRPAGDRRAPGAATRPSDFWSLRALVAATLTAAASGFSNWSHDVGGYLGERLVERCPKELLLRWVQFGCFTPLMQAHGRFEQEAWTYDEQTLDALPRVRPAARAARARTCARRRRPRRAAGCRSCARCAWSTRPTRAAGRSPTPTRYGPALWVAPVLEEGAREREVALPRGDWIDFWTRRARARRRRAAWRPRRSTGSRCGCARARSSSPTRPSTSPRASATRPRPSARSRRRCGASRRSAAPASRLADGTRIRWRRGEWSVDREREITFAER